MMGEKGRKERKENRILLSPKGRGRESGLKSRGEKKGLRSLSYSPEAKKGGEPLVIGKGKAESGFILLFERKKGENREGKNRGK